MMTSELLMDLVEEILSRVPAISLKRLRSTCKQWNALFKDKRFREKHLRNAPKHSTVLMFKDSRVSSMSVNLNAPIPSVEFNDGGVLGLEDSHGQVNIGYVFHCDGLLLCTTNDYRLVVWNPLLGEKRWIQLNSGIDNCSFQFVLGYQNNNTCRRYKIMRSWVSSQPNLHVAGFEVYDFSTDSWRVYHDSVLDCFGLPIGMSLKGNTYWTRKTSLLCFDFTTEKFKHMCLPHFQNFGSLALSVVKEEQLSLLHHSFATSTIEIWVTNKTDIDTEVTAMSWSISFTVEAGNASLNHFRAPFCFLIDGDKKVALCCNIRLGKGGHMIYIIGEDDEHYTEISYVESTKKFLGRPFIFDYFASLVQLQ